jgi:hypothetical protein
MLIALLTIIIIAFAHDIAAEIASDGLAPLLAALACLAAFPALYAVDAALNGHVFESLDRYLAFMAALLGV